MTHALAMPLMPRQRGFTLIELMVVVVIIAILAAIAYPSYQAQIVRANESAAQQRLQSLGVELERWKAKALTYKNFTPESGYATGATVYVPANATAGNYKYLVTIQDGTSNTILTDANADGRRWRMKAEPNPGNTIVSKGLRFYMDSQGRKCAYPDPTKIDLTAAESTLCNSTSQVWK